MTSEHELRQEVLRHLRVALATLYPVDPTLISGGVRAVAHNLVRGLSRFPDLDVQVVHCHSEVPQDKVVTEWNVTVHYRAMSQRRIIPNTVAAVGKVQRILGELSPDVVNAHNGHYAVAALRARLPTVYTVHGVPFREAPSYVHRGIRERLRYYLEVYYAGLAMRHVKHAIAISPYVMREYEGRTRAQWYRIDNPLPDEFFLSGTGQHGQEGRVLFVGTITEVKDILTLLQAITRIVGGSSCDGQPSCSSQAFGDIRTANRDQPVSLRLAGRTTSPEYENTLKTYVSEHDLEDVVTFLGGLERRALLKEYAECAVVALPSRQENAPMAIIEAMAAGKPVVATRVGGIPDLVEDGQTGFLVEPGDAMGMADSLVRLLSDATLRERMGGEARRRAVSRFRMEAVAQKYREVYYSVAGKPCPMDRLEHRGCGMAEQAYSQAG